MTEMKTSHGETACAALDNIREYLDLTYLRENVAESKRLRHL